MKKHLPVKQFNEIKKTFQATKQNGFVTAINARIVHEWLGVGRDFSTWIRARIEKYKFKEHVDYCIVEVLSSPNRGTAKSRTQTKKEYHCTPDMVKQLAMIENSDKGQLVRLYFLDCEIKANEKQKQIEDRQTLKVEFRPMTDAIADSHDDPKPYHFSNEADMINRIVLGMSSAKFKAHHEIEKNESVRDYMSELQMKAVIDLQRANTVFIQLGENYEDRKEKLSKMFSLRFEQALIEEVKRIEC